MVLYDRTDLWTHLEVASEIEALGTPRFQMQTIALAVGTESLMFSPLLDALEVVVVSTYSDHIALIVQTYAAFVVDDIEGNDLSVEDS